MKKKGGRKKVSESEMRKNYCVRFNEKEFGQALCRAAMYMDGNFSAWIRFATMHCRPGLEELKDFKAKLVTKKKPRFPVNRNLMINKMKKKDLGKWSERVNPLTIDVLKKNIF